MAHEHQDLIFNMPTPNTKPTPSRGPATGARGGFGGRGGAGGRGGGRGGSRGPRPARPIPDMDFKVVDMRRVARVVSGGRRFTFRATVVAGDKKGRVGMGTAKGRDTTLAIDKAFRRAKMELITVPLTDKHTIPHEIERKEGPSRVLLVPGRRGIVAGSSVRTVLELAGIKNVSAKILSRSSNKLNNARAAIMALADLKKK